MLLRLDTAPWIALILAGCATSPGAGYAGSGGTGEAGVDASAEPDVQDSGDAAPESDASADAPEESAADACEVFGPGDASGPCSPGERERAWCGRCGRTQRICLPSGTWNDWSPCFEDELAECSPCESGSAPCGNCGTQTLWCDTSNDRCRWVRGACGATGECSPGQVETGGTCDGDAVQLRSCGAACTFEEWTTCQAPPRWQSLADAPLSPRTDFVAIASPIGWIIWGGFDGTVMLDDGALYDASSDTWTELDAPADDAGTSWFEARRSAAAAWAGGGLFVFGGQGNGALGDGAMWSSSEGWRPVSVDGAPSARIEASATVLGDGSLLVFGGRSGYGSAAVGGGRYAPSKDTWTSLPAAPFGNRQDHSAVLDEARERVIVWGGRPSDGSLPEASGAIFDPSSGAWSSMADAPIRRAGHAAFWDAPRDRMLVLFGEDGSWPGHRSDGAAYYPETDTWQWLPDVSWTGFVPSHGSAVFAAQDMVWAIGGEANRGVRLALGSDSWSPVPGLLVKASHARGFVASSIEREPVYWGLEGGARLVGYPP